MNKAGNNKKTVQQVEIDIQRIFLTPPNTKKEKLTLLIILVLAFMLFFGPVCFSPVSPVKAILLSAFAALSLAWGWMVLFRSLFRKSEFCK